MDIKQMIEQANKKAAEILTTATRSPRFICHRQRSDRSPKTLLKPAV